MNVSSLKKIIIVLAHVLLLRTDVANVGVMAAVVHTLKDAHIETPATSIVPPSWTTVPAYFLRQSMTATDAAQPSTTVLVCVAGRACGIFAGCVEATTRHAQGVLKARLAITIQEQKWIVVNV